MFITAAVITACLAYWLLSVRAWNRQCAEAREKFQTTHH